MDNSLVLERLIEDNNGYLLTSMEVENGISKPFLAKYVKENEMERVARGVYISNDVWPDVRSMMPLGRLLTMILW